MRGLSQFPYDVLLHLASFLDLEDAFSFSRLSFHFRSLAKERIFWVQILNQARKSRPFPVALHENLSEYSVDDLRSLALHTTRMERNLLQPEPEILGFAKSFECGPSSKILFVIPGTELIVTHSERTGTATCWKLSSGEELCSLHLGVGTVHVISRKIEEHGKSHVGLEVASNSTILVFVILVDYGSAGVTMKIQFRQEFADILTESFCFDMDIVAVPVFSPLHGTLNIHIFPLSLEVESPSSVVYTDIPSHYRYQPHRRLGPMTLIDRNLYLLVDHKDVKFSYFWLCPSRRLPYDSSTMCHGDKRRSSSNTMITSSFSHTTAPFDSSQESYNHFGHYESRTMLRFWNLESGGDLPATPSHTLATEGILCLSAPRLHSTTPFSSLYGTFSADRSSGRVSLRILRYTPYRSGSGRSASVHTLHLPPAFDLYDISSCFLDEYRGVLLLMDTKGTLSSIPYA